MPDLTCTVSGSFRKHLASIESKILELQFAGFAILSPKTTRVIGEERGFVILEGDRGSPQTIEQAHLNAIRSSDLLYVVNPGGYVGPSAAMEIGYAAALGVTIFASETPEESILASFMQTEPNVGRVRDSVLESLNCSIPRGASLSQLQAYVRKVVALRGFDKESLRDVVLLMVEEVGELAKATRRQIGLKVGATNIDAHKAVAHELADCLIYLLDIANIANVDLDIAFREKENINSQKVWNSFPSA
ncbi:MAG: hypothetical protein NT171_16565 [Planctomycetota bacterium]|nr:hypothetical protein [Planctomycetota bacterium]